MLKKFLSVVMSLSIVGTTLATMPTFADSRKVENVTTVVNESFADATITAPQSDGIGSVGSNIKFKGHTFNDSVQNVSVETDGYLKTKIDAGQTPRLGIVPNSEVKINQGDILHISFDFKQNYATRVLLLLGDNYNTAAGWTDDSKDAPGYTDTTTNNDMLFTPIDGSFSGRWIDDNDTNSLSNRTGSGQGFRRAIAVWGNVYNKNNSVGIGASIGQYVKNDIMNGNSWTNIDIKINTADSTQDGKQTIKVKYTFADNTTKEYYGILDAKYSGESDDTTDVINTLNYLVVRPYWPNSEFEFSIDNVLVEKTSYSNEYYTSTVKHLIDYDFSNDGVRSYNKELTSSSSFSVIDTVDADNGVYFRKSYNPTANGEVVKDNIDGKDVYAFKQKINDATTDMGTSTLIFMNPEGTTKLEKGDIIRFSYDAKNETPTNLSDVWSYRYSPQLNLPRHKEDNWSDDTKNNPIEVEPDVYHIGTDNQEKNKPDYKEGYGMLLETRADGLTRYASYSRYDGINDNKTIEQNKWHHYEFVINTADEAKGGNQSMKVYIDGDKTFYDVLDINIENNEMYAYTEFTALEMKIYAQKTASELGSIYSTNYKLDIIKPGFGIDGNAIKDNNPTDGIKLNPGTMTVTCAVNLPGSAKGKNEVEKKNVTVFAAQYSGDCLIGVVSKNVEMSEYDNTTSLECEVLSGADSVKLFAFDENLTPLLVNETGVVTNGADAQAIEYSNSFGSAVD